MANLKLKRKCGNCKHLEDSPFVHCTLGADVTTDTYNANGFIPMPEDPAECKELRIEQLELTG